MNVSNPYRNSIKQRKYSDDYLQFGFSLIENNDYVKIAHNSDMKYFFLIS